VLALRCCRDAKSSPGGCGAEEDDEGELLLTPTTAPPLCLLGASRQQQPQQMRCCSTTCRGRGRRRGSLRGPFLSYNDMLTLGRERRRRMCLGSSTSSEGEDAIFVGAGWQ